MTDSLYDDRIAKIPPFPWSRPLNNEPLILDRLRLACKRFQSRGVSVVGQWPRGLDPANRKALSDRWRLWLGPVPFSEHYIGVFFDRLDAAIDKVSPNHWPPLWTIQHFLEVRLDRSVADQAEAGCLDDQWADLPEEHEASHLSFANTIIDRAKDELSIDLGRPWESLRRQCVYERSHEINHPEAYLGDEETQRAFWRDVWRFVQQCLNPAGVPEWLTLEVLMRVPIAGDIDHWQRAHEGHYWKAGR